MPSDAWADLNRRALAAGYDMDDDGICIAFTEKGRPMGSTIILCNPTREEVNRILGGHNGFGEPVDVIGPDLSHAGTRGILREALGSPGIDVEHVPGRGWWIARLRWRGSYGLKTRAVRVPGDATREQAEAAALVALAEARGQWGTETA